MISIIIPVYNHAKELGLCLDSVLRQDFIDLEVIIVDDGSQDSLQKVLEEQKEKFNKRDLRLKIIHQDNKGANSARNRGFLESSGNYIIFFDADIVMKPIMLKKMRNALKVNSEASYAYSSFKFGFKIFKLWEFDSKKLQQMPYIHTSSLIRRSDFSNFDESIKKLQDWDLWLTMLENGHKGVWIPEILFKVKPRKIGMSFWLPSFFYKIPWQKFGISFNKVRQYENAVKIIKEKHKIL
ncbi:MAG: glycosyltransferase family A protein [Patescibacteria group bacterium]|nr:glycosyltransferase family A protein [Patescibacteria group bacterium]